MERVVQSEGTAATDRELVKRCQAGEEAAFDELVLRHRTRAFHIAYPLLQNHEDATEVAQDTFVRVYHRIAEFRGECEFTTWLYQIVINLARNKRRWWKRRGRQQAVPLDANLAASTATPDGEAARADFLERLQLKAAELPAKFREALLLRSVEGMSYEQIAVMLDCSIGTVKSRIARGREQLREAMREERM